MTAKKLGLTAMAAAAALAAMGGPASAHHAFSMYDNVGYVSLTGTVKKFTWQNPHAMLDLEVAMPEGGTKTWSVELSAPNIIGRRGWSKTSLTVGQRVPVVIHAMKDGSLHGLMVRVTLPDGTVLKDKA